MIKMNNIIEMNPKEGNSICTVSCIYNVLLFLGEEITEYETYLLINGFKTKFNSGYVALNTFQEINQELRELGEFQTTWLKNSETDTKTIIDNVINGTPVIVLIDSSFLSFDARLIKEYPFLRTFIIYGVDLEKNVFLVYDTFYMNEEQEIEVICFSVPIKLIIENGKEFLTIFNDGNRGKRLDYKKILAERIENYLGHVKGKMVDEIFGVDAVEHHIWFFENSIDRHDKSNRGELCYYATNTIIYGTFVPMMTYLLEFVENYDLVEKEIFISSLKELKTKWYILSNKAMKLTVSKKENQIDQFIYRYKETFEETINFLENFREKLVIK